MNRTIHDFPLKDYRLEVEFDLLNPADDARLLIGFKSIQLTTPTAPAREIVDLLPFFQQEIVADLLCHLMEEGLPKSKEPLQ